MAYTLFGNHALTFVKLPSSPRDRRPRPQHLPHHPLALLSPEPFHIVVTARILTTPHPDRPITLQTHPSPLDGLHNRSFADINCTTDPTKRIVVWPTGWPQYRWDSEDLRDAWDFVTIPPPGQGSLEVRHEVPRGKIEAAGVVAGERYRVSLTDKCLGTWWFAFARLEELEGVRLSAWQSAEDDERMNKADPEYFEEQAKERREKFGDGPSSMGEDPSALAMVLESGEAGFSIT